ncbi:hypothetical protein TcYC6_0045080 [Trypanosoma cruzi]|nr:hypothetical protein TcYC6_0045080 [Trypanosoma cruzi]
MAFYYSFHDEVPHFSPQPNVDNSCSTGAVYKVGINQKYRTELTEPELSDEPPVAVKQRGRPRRDDADGARCIRRASRCSQAAWVAEKDDADGARCIRRASRRSQAAWAAEKDDADGARCIRRASRRSQAAWATEKDDADGARCIRRASHCSQAAWATEKDDADGARCIRRASLAVKQRGRREGRC